MIVVCFACAPQAMAGILIGSTLDAIYDIDPVSGVASNPRVTPSRARGIEFADGILYGVEANTLSTIDVASGEAHSLGTITGLGPLEAILDLSWNAQTDTLFALAHLGGTTTDLLYTIHTSSLAATLVGELDDNTKTIAFDASGALYAISINPDIVSLVDPITAVTLSSTFLSTDIQTARMVFADMDHPIISARIDGDPGFVFDLNLADGTLSGIGTTGLDVGLTSLAYIPEPSMCFLVLFGVLGFLMRRGACRPVGLMLEPSGKSVYDMMPCRGQATFFRGIRIISRTRGT